MENLSVTQMEQRFYENFTLVEGDVLLADKIVDLFEDYDGHIFDSASYCMVGNFLFVRKE